VELYTDYWHNPYLWSDNARDATLIGISRSTPWWRLGYKALKLLAPNRELFVWYKHDGAITADEN